MAICLYVPTKQKVRALTWGLPAFFAVIPDLGQEIKGRDLNQGSSLQWGELSACI